MNIIPSKYTSVRNWPKSTTATLALMLLAGQVAPAFATIDNTVTVNGTGPTGPVTANANASVDVADATPQIAIVKSWVFAPGGDVNNNGLADAGDVIAYSYAVTNNGNVTLKNVTVADAHQGVGAPLAIVVPTSVTTDAGSAPAQTLNDSTDAPAPADGDWDVLGPGDVITFTAAYTVVAGDLSAPTSSDGMLDGAATATGTYDGSGPPQTVTANSSGGVPLNQAPALSISKVADDTTEVVAGQVITYTYTVSNTGNVPITNVTLTDTHNGVSGALVPAFQSFTTNTGSTNTGNTITVLQPGDVAVFTASYTVTQADVDTRQ